MRNTILILAFMLIGSFAFANNNLELVEKEVASVEISEAKLLEVKNDETKDLAKCEISDPGGFYGSGNCKKVLAAYRQWQAMQQD